MTPIGWGLPPPFNHWYQTSALPPLHLLVWEQLPQHICPELITVHHPARGWG